ncbi:hypothetical protein HCEG_01080 [Histoplasma capsulatum var. duboisii H88]|uniref:Uncharacterized protein n=2 Tax=Ajellomyces capsulatus TaxID=5037 RepID=F0U8G8_AJEC8|nr:hypothetical protein HCDG_01351 [Histoplasma capsulatum H143]EGC41718.1 hypothetical protein HCEG_01080 [Histoplasma capsulatum var. duboisii H88]
MQITNRMENAKTLHGCPIQAGRFLLRLESRRFVILQDHLQLRGRNTARLRELNTMALR